MKIHGFSHRFIQTNIITSLEYAGFLVFNEMERGECLRTVAKLEMEGVNVVAFIIKYNNIAIRRHATERKCLLVSIVAFFTTFLLRIFFLFFLRHLMRRNDARESFFLETQDVRRISDTNKRFSVIRLLVSSFAFYFLSPPTCMSGEFCMLRG